MQLQSVYVFISALAVTTASPLRPRCDATPTTSVTYILPTTGGATSLPAPDTPLKHIVVGHGVQNYTCNAVGVAGTSIGALAVLHDITDLYPGSGPYALSSASWGNLTSQVLRTTSQPIDASNAVTPFPAPADLTVSGIPRPLAFIGHHYFDTTGTPTFSLHDNAELLKAAKVTGITAPSTADRGLTSEGAVDWLLLSDKGGSVILTKVYRVLTSGGSPAVCGAVGDTQSVPYTAMYWFY
ncbi:hypothetical protein E0Z10_g9739 [Xylaria hypoxylon]|uniref:Malate dehydrogenase n=1 Tax=Xylaria hypoxylon TaxID=37992 RepID=A0A4Z0YGE3_9PEZI|nr:hypothetical protein E0Z10_g9739 [Xylaria hypoxylon]